MRTLGIIMIMLPFLGTTISAQPPVTGFCIENGDDRAALFVVDAGTGFREAATLAPGARLCTPEFALPTQGFVSVFYNADAVEGCSRLAKAGSVQVLLKYSDFDNCAWQTRP